MNFQRSILLSGLLVLCSLQAHADWVPVSASDAFGELTVYIEPKSINRIGSKVSVWTLTDFKTSKKLPNGKEIQSYRMLEEYDCEKRLQKFVYVTAHSGRMANGDTVEADWAKEVTMPISPGAVNEAVFLRLCK